MLIFLPRVLARFCRDYLKQQEETIRQLDTELQREKLEKARVLSSRSVLLLVEAGALVIVE